MPRLFCPSDLFVASGGDDGVPWPGVWRRVVETYDADAAASANATSPAASSFDFSLCFELIVLSLVPDAVLLLFALFRLHYLHRRAPHGQKYKWHIHLNRALAATNAVLSIAYLAVVASLSIANVVSAAFHVAASLAAAWLLTFEHTRLLRASTGLLLYWLISAIVLAIQIRSFVLDEYSDGKPAAFALLIIHFVITIFTFILENVTRAVNDEGNPQRAYPFGGNVNVFPRITYWYMQGIMMTGAKRPLEMSDLWLPSKSQSATYVHDRFITRWRAELKARPDNPSLYRTIFTVYSPLMVMSIVQAVIATLLSFVQPLVLDQLISFVNDGDRPDGIGYLLAVVVFIASFVALVISVQVWVNNMAVGYQVRSGLSVAVFQKALRLSNGARQTTSNGAITNLIASDCVRLTWMFQSLTYPFTAPISIALTMYLLWQQIGPACLVGIAIILLTMPLQGLIGKATGRLQKRHLTATDARVKLIDETLNSIRLLKYYSWDILFRDRITATRGTEVRALKSMGFVKALDDVLGALTPLLVALMSFVAFSIIHRNDGQTLTANKIFVSFNLFSLLASPMDMIGFLFTSAASAKTSFTRLRNFLILEELEADAVQRSADGEADPAVEISNASFAWEANGEPVLKDVQLSVSRGSLTAILGRVGQGKSSLISALLGDMYKKSGSVRMAGSVAYVSQQAWIENLTVRDSILFGSEYDATRYNAVIEACSLTRDLAAMDAGDQTEIGERGINLSGGQKQRIQLARAAYSNADILIFDDPLSAVDAHVDNHIFQRLIGPNGLLKSKTRILVTHGINHLHQCDKVIVLDSNTIAEQGTFEDLMQKDCGLLRGVVESVAKGDEQAVTGGDGATAIESSLADVDEANNADQPETKKESDSEDATTEDGDSLNGAKDDKKDEKSNVKGDGKLIQNEKISRGRVSRNVYGAYINAAGVGWVIFNLLLLVAMQVAKVGSTVWLEHWTTEIAGKDSGPHSTVFYLGIYAALIVATSILAYATNMTMYTVTGMNAARKMHKSMLKSVMRAPMAWFDVTPVGRITNRFAQDIRTVDEMVVGSFVQFFTNLGSALATLGVICSVTPLFLVLVVPVGITFYLLQNYYLKTSREMKRLNSVANSPIYSLAGTTISGAAVIRSFGKQHVYFDKFSDLQDLNQSGLCSMIASNKWLQVRIETLGAVIAAGAAVFAVVERRNLTPGMAGLSLSYAFQIVNYLYTIMRVYGDIENSSTSIERLVEYSNLESEAPENTTALSLPESWPERGAVTFTDYSLRYRPNTPLVLKNLNISVKPGEKVGIVGRTGAGKSSLSVALFRIVEAAAGSITVDGVDIATVGLADLRSRMTIIPQDPILFASTVRENLDPTGRCTDAELWAALEKSHLKEKVIELGAAATTDSTETEGSTPGGGGGGLDALVQSGGDNLSVGERQLLCLARAILRKSAVLVLDEATAGIDLQTDALLQATIRREFKAATVLTVAHRIRTILDSDRVLVMDAGRVAEFDTPARLREDPGSLFAKLVESSGL
ncbi:P-loop containing nucleoside triphosphate hydrolase protein [Zopfochytrium polystomum]|nr:P-loop containing nucleoside triphosphate hydrolase protein [Zopfochytrium polystomum]